MHFSDENVARFERIAPTVVYDVTVPGTWQEALRRLGAGVDREQQASDAIGAFDEELQAAKQTLAPVIAAAPRISVIYSNYRGSGDNFVFGEEFALAAVYPHSASIWWGSNRPSPTPCWNSYARHWRSSRPEPRHRGQARNPPADQSQRRVDDEGTVERVATCSMFRPGGARGSYPPAHRRVRW